MMDSHAEALRRQQSNSTLTPSRRVTDVVKHSLRIKARFALVLIVIVPTLLCVGGVGLIGLRAERNAAGELYQVHVRNAEDATDLGVRLGDAHAATLEMLLQLGNAGATTVLETEFLSSISPDVEVGIATVRVDSADNATETADLGVIAKGWTHLLGLRASGALSVPGPAARATEVSAVEATFDPMTAAAKSIVHSEADEARSAYERVLSSYSSSIHVMILVLVLGLVAATGLVVWLIRSVLTRTLAYSSFARSVSEGDFTKRLPPRGDDELDQLGSTLELLALRRQSEEKYEGAMREFTDTLQLTETEQDAHDLLKRYVERAISGCTVTIFNRNNSADRLEPVTAVPAGSPLLDSLVGASPRSCLAVRMARPHAESVGADPLLPCPVCSNCPQLTTCTPFLVGGEVIGSVLANHEATLTDSEERSIRDAVVQSAPVLANLRNLAVAERRSATDALTGLPNRRAIEDTLKRMVAQSSRTVMPLAALMCDLDHFKQINDEFGHGSGDDVLAAFGSVLVNTLRSGDFAGRYGGEEFLVLLPATGADGALEIAERVRRAVSEIRVPAVTHRVTLSIGLAVIPDHAIDADSLERAADRALYAAKNAGRDRVELCASDLTTVDPQTTQVELRLANGAVPARRVAP
jgi:diguanylate cyclase (GGDEF)-like protein